MSQLRKKIEDNGIDQIEDDQEFMGAEYDTFQTCVKDLWEEFDVSVAEDLMG